MNPTIGQATFVKFFKKYGRFYEPRDHFYFHRLHERLSALGFKILSIERRADYPGWEIRLKASIDVNLNLFVCQSCCVTESMELFPDRLFDRQMRGCVRKIIRDLGWPIRSKQILVGRSGVYVQVYFSWPVGKPGVWKPPPKPFDPFAVSLIARRWLRGFKN